MVGSVEGKGKRYGVEIARKVEVWWGPLRRIVSRLDLGLEGVLSCMVCSFLAKEGERDASVYHALSTGTNLGLFGPSVGEMWEIWWGVSEKTGESGESGDTEETGEIGEIGEIGDSSLCGHGVEGVSRRSPTALQLIGGREREAKASLIFRQKVFRQRGDFGSLGLWSAMETKRE